MNTSPKFLLSAIRDLHPDLVRQCLNGSCFKLFILLKEVYPDAVAYYDGDHVITKIGDRFWDIRGEVLKDRHIPLDPMEFNRAYLWGTNGY